MEALHQPGDIIAQRYRITDTLGQGGVGITYAAEDLKNGEQVALKVLSLRGIGEWKVLELFEREAKVLAQLNHPAIPRYLDYFQVDTAEDRAFYIVQQLAEGKSLDYLAKIGWRTNEDGVRKIAAQILEILVYLHELKPPVVHRDIKPQNLIWGKDAKIFLVDFGAVQDTYRTTFAKGSTIVGTYGYMAPEQFRGQAVPATDLYGLGATVLFLLTHRSPSDLPQERLKISFRSRIQVSEGFADWLEKMLEPDVEDRFSSAKEALAALQGRVVVAKPRRTVSWKVLAGVGVAGIAAFFGLNSYKWAVLGALGFKPSGICEAAQRGNIDVVRDYLKHGGNPNAEDDTEQLLLNCASQSSKKDIVELLIAKGADVKAKDRQGGTPLHYATRTREITELLITKGADVRAKDNQGKTPLHMISSEEQAELLIAEGADVNAKDNQRNTPLLLAMLMSKSELARLLIARGADVNVKDNQGNTPLLLAMRWSQMGSSDSQKKGLARLLIAKGADVNVKDNQGNTPLLLARDNDLVTLLIAKGADINAKDNQGKTPLHMAWNNDLVTLLIAKGADINAKDNQGQTLLHIALGWVPRNSKEMVPLLIAKGADVNAKDNQGATPLEVAFRTLIEVDYLKDQEARIIMDTIVLLMAKGAQSSNNGINPRDNEGYTLLHYAAGDGSKEAVEVLIAKGAQVNANDNQCGCTPLHWAAKSGSKDTAELLIAKGADVNAKAKSGLTPLDEATIMRQENMVKLLRSHGAVGHSCSKIDGFGIVCQVNP